MNITDLLALRAPQSIQGVDETAPVDTPKKDALGRADFLNMLLAQLENQDPLDPQDATEFTAQLATFSMLEQLVSIKDGIDKIETLLDDATVVPGNAAKTAVTP